MTAPMLSVVVGTFGASEWYDLAWSRAYPSAREQDGIDTDEIRVIHGNTLAEARNTGAGAVHGRYLIFLDADDELRPGYITAMRAAIRANRSKKPTLFTPMVEYVTRRRRGPDIVEGPKFWPEVDPTQGNWLVIGTAVPHDLFDEVGGFEEWPMYEDWALFARMQKAGARVVKVPDAVYRAHRRVDGRNHQGPNARREAFDLIHRAVWPELHDEEDAA